MAARWRLRACGWALGALLVLAAAACSTAREESTPVGDSVPVTAQGAVVSEFELCEDIAPLESSVMGNLERVLDQVEDPGLRYKTAIRRYGQEHRATYGGQWTDSLAGGVIVVAFTDEPETHRVAIAEYVPSAGTFDIVQVTHSEGELLALHHGLSSYMGPEFGLNGVGLNTTRNRVTLHFADPPDGALAEMAQLVPVDMVCAQVVRSPEPPSGPLAVIPDLAAEDPMVVCGRFGPMPYSRFEDPPRLDDVDHPAADRLRAALDSPPGRLLPAGEYHVMDIGEDAVSFAAFSDEGMARVTLTYGRGRWRIGRWSSDAYSCEVRATLPPGLGYVAVYRDAEAERASGNGALHLLVRVSACAKGREQGDALRGPQVVETDDEVLVAFAAVGPSVTYDCVGDPWFTPVTIMLSDPLGSRVLRDGTYLPPKEITEWEDRHSQGAHEPVHGAPADFVAMWGHERGDMSNDARLGGTLVIEAPCVYVVSNIGLDEPGSGPRYMRTLVQLPRSGTRFDSDTGEMWVWDEGPLLTGDQVAAGGGEGWSGGDAAGCAFDAVWAATGLTLIPQPGFSELLDSSDKVRLAWTAEAWRSLNVDDVRWASFPQSVAEIAAESTLVVVGRLRSIDFDPVYVPQRDNDTQAALRAVGLSHADVRVSVERVVAGEFRHHRSGLVQVSVWQDGPLPEETYLIRSDTRPTLLFLQAKDDYFASRGIDPSTLIEGLDADTAARTAAAWDTGYFLTSVEGVLISTPDGLWNPLLSPRPGADDDEPSSTVQRDANTMSLPELEQAIRDALPHASTDTWIADAVSYVPAPPFEAMLHGHQYGPLSVDMGDALQGPQLIETDDEVLVAFAVIPVSGGATCPGNPPTPVTVKLSQPLGERALLNAARMPPAPIQLRPGRQP